MSNYRPGDPKAVCDICGFTYHLSELRYNHKKQRVCRHDWDPKDPLELVRPIPERPPVHDARPEPDPTYISTTCTLAGRSGAADYAQADCAVVGVEAPYTIPSGTFDGSL